MRNGKVMKTNLAVLNRRVNWSWTKARERSTFTVSVFKFSGESNQHVSIEGKPSSSRFYRLPLAFQQLRVLLETIVKKGWLGEAVLDLKEEQGMRPHSSLVRRWEITWRMVDDDSSLLRYRWIGSRFPVQLWLKWVHDLRAMTGNSELKTMDDSVYIEPERIALLPLPLQKEWAGKLNALDVCTAVSTKTTYIFRGWHPQHGFIFKRKGTWWSFRGNLPQPETMAGRARKVTFGGQTVWCSGLWIPVQGQ